MEQVWWPLFGSFENLHPDYEVYDGTGNRSFSTSPSSLPSANSGWNATDIKATLKTLDREAFSYALNRDNFLTGIGWTMLHFSFDDIKNKPEIRRMMLQMVIGPYLIRSTPDTALDPAEKEILRLAWSLDRYIRPKDVRLHLAVDFRTGRKRLRSLVDKGLLKPSGTGGPAQLRRLEKFQRRNAI
ncbi:hypothetical protein [Paenibacillus sp. DYY-L-2]|uniref:hypothetical protein n=1 Tax=Paenibacillus sp. DYY-L-2 TaxID=3447013 RepID=UPI003F504CE1